MSAKNKIIYTVGHSNRTLSYFIDLLLAFEIECVVDVRTIPRSRKNPQFNEDELKRSLKEYKMGYIHLEKLGGLRHAHKDSKNTGWINASFRGFADYMQTKEFKEGIAQLLDLASENRCVLLCAEAVPWRCHRSLIADALTVKKWHVFHIQSRKTAKPHEITPFLHREGRSLLYY